MSLAGPRLSPASSSGVTGVAAPEVASVQPMTILIVTGIFPPEIGGPATYVPLIASKLAERSHKVTVLTATARGGHDDAQYPFKVVRVRRRGPLPLRMLGVITAVLRHGRKADVLYVNGLPLQSAVANLVIRKPLVMKVVGDMAWERATLRGWTEDRFDDFQRRRYGTKVEALKELRRWWTRRADRIVANSFYTASWVADWGVASERITVVHNSVEAAHEVVPTQLPLETSINLITVGRLVPWKGLDGLVTAITQFGDVGLVIVGDGVQRHSLEDLAKNLHVEDRVYFAGQRNRRELLSLLAAADIFVLNSSWESFAHVVLEAMSVGVPVIVPAIGGPMEVVEDGRTGIYVGSGFQTLSGAIHTLVGDPNLRRQMGQIGQLVAREKFSVEKMVASTEGVLSAVARPAGKACSTLGSGRV